MYQKLSLGTAQFGLNYGIANQSGMVSDYELTEILRLANKYQVNTLDTAIAYGKAEERLGQYDLNKFEVISKLPEISNNVISLTNGIETFVVDSLRRLNIPSLHGLLLHRPLELLSYNGAKLYESLCALRELQLVTKIGISVYSPEELDAIDKTGMMFDIVQIPFNILDNRFILSGWLDKLANKDIEIHARSIFLQGILLMSSAVLPEKFNHWRSLWDEWYSWLNHNQLNALSTCLNYVLSFEQINKVIVGVDSSSQFDEILQNILYSGSPIMIPDSLKIVDQDLLNPARWSLL